MLSGDGRLLLYSECVTVLDQKSEMIILEFLLATCEVRVVFRGTWGTFEFWLKFKTKPP